MVVLPPGGSVRPLSPLPSGIAVLFVRLPESYPPLSREAGGVVIYRCRGHPFRDGPTPNRKDPYYYSILLAIDEWEESRRAERDERTELDKRLQVAREAIRARALSRKRSTAAPREGKDQPKNTERKRAMSYDSDDEARCTLSEHMSEQRNVDHKHLKMEECKLEYEMSRDERARERLKVAQDHEARRIAVEEKRMELDERRLEIEREERRGAIQERTRMMAVLSALAKTGVEVV